MVTVELHIRRFDLTDEPDVERITITLDSNLEYNELKSTIRNACGVLSDDNKVIKLRNADNVIIPFSFLIEDSTSIKNYFIDVKNINYVNNNGTSLLQDAYVESLRRKLQSMETRIEQAELLLPQLEWKRQAHIEETVNRLFNKVNFLNRRFDELLPTQWRPKTPQTLA